MGSVFRIDQRFRLDSCLDSSTAIVMRRCDERFSRPRCNLSDAWDHYPRAETKVNEQNDVEQRGGEHCDKCRCREIHYSDQE